MTFCPNSPLINPTTGIVRQLRARRDLFLICMSRLLLQTSSLAAFNSVNCLIDRVLQKLQPAADNHFSLAITLSFVIEFLTLIATRPGSLKVATGFRLRTEQLRRGQRSRCPFKGTNCLIDRVLQKLQPAADNHFSVTITLSFVVEFLTLIDLGFASFKFTTGLWLGTEQRRCWQG